MSLVERMRQTTEPKFWMGEIPTYYLYTLGVAGERFFREIKDNARILGTRCPECELVYVPPRIYCERCFGSLDEWVEVSARGEVHTYTVLYLDLDGLPLEEPLVIAMINLDGADGGLVHMLAEISPDEVEIGLEVEAVFKDKAQRTGSILDIEYFKPTE